MYKASFFVHANLNVSFPFPCFAFIDLPVSYISPFFSFGRRAPGYRVTTQSIVTMKGSLFWGTLLRFFGRCASSE